MGDWLINYEGGFVRRGLPGEMALLVARLLHVSVVPVMATLQAACVLCLVACLWPTVGLVFRRGSSVWEKALLFSPATLAFLWLDPGLILRKEIALFALLGVVALLLRRRPELSDTRLAALLAVACPLLLLSHEGLVCYLPYAVAMVAVGRQSVRRALRIFSVPAILSGVAVVVATLHPGNQGIADRICAAVGGPDTGLCAGPIGYLGLSRAQYAAEVAGLAQDRRMLLVFVVTAALALAPAIAGLADLWRRPVSRNTRAALPAAFFAATLASAVLFVQAQDWSRWIYIHIMCLWLMLSFAVGERERVARPASQTQPPRARWWTVLVLVLYVTTWHLPEWILAGVRDYKPFGYMGLVQRIERHKPADGAPPR